MNNSIENLLGRHLAINEKIKIERNFLFWKNKKSIDKILLRKEEFYQLNLIK